MRRPFTREDFIGLLGICRDARDLAGGKRLHDQLLDSEYRRDKLLCDLLLQMYSKCGSFHDASSVFEFMAGKTVMSWNIMLSACTQNGHLDGGCKVFERMPCWNVCSCNAILGSFAYNSLLEEAKSMFDSLPQLDMVSWNSMVSAYAQKGHFKGAKNAFDRMPERDVVSWNALISAYANKGHLVELEMHFHEMPQRNCMSWNTRLQACISCGSLQQARITFHNRMPQRDVVSWNSLLAGFANFDNVTDAKSLFACMPCRSVVAWSSLLQAFVQNGSLAEAEDAFDRMPSRNVVSWTTMLQGYVQTHDIQGVDRIFWLMPERDVVAWNCILMAYANAGLLGQAWSTYQMMAKHDTVTWNSMITALALSADVEGAKRVFDSMPHQREPTTLCALIAAFAQNGLLQQAQKVFEDVLDPSVETWNAIISAYGQFGDGNSAFCMLRRMCLNGVQPNDTSFRGVLMGCSHVGVVSDCWQCFAVMTGDYCLAPRIEHYCCIVQVLGRVGQIAAAYELIGCMPFVPDNVTWAAFLAVCRMHRDAQLGRRAATRFMAVDSASSAPHVLFANILREGRDVMPEAPG